MQPGWILFVLTSETKRGRGRPKTKAIKQVAPNWKRFNCIYANSVAQVYQCAPVPATASGLTKAKPNDPTGQFAPGDCFVTFLNQREGEFLLDMYPFPGVERYQSKGDAIDQAVELFEIDEEGRFGDDPHPHPRGQHRLYANPVYDVRYWSDNDTRCDKPFVVFHRGLGRLLLDGRGSTHRFTNLHSAILMADELIKGMSFA